MITLQGISARERNIGAAITILQIESCVYRKVNDALKCLAIRHNIGLGSRCRAAVGSFAALSATFIFFASR